MFFEQFFEERDFLLREITIFRELSDQWHPISTAKLLDEFGITPGDFLPPDRRFVQSRTLRDATDDTFVDETVQPCM